MPLSDQAYNSRLYFASSENEDFANRLLAKVEELGTDERTSQIRSLLSRAYLYYYGFDNEGLHGSSSISRGGEVGELSKYRANHARAVCNTLLNLVVSQRVVFAPRATNIDYESLKQVEVAKAVLEYYWTDARIEQLVYHATEEAIAFSEGFVLGLWDEFAGEDSQELDPSSEDPENPKTLKTGDFVFENVSTWQVFRDPSKKSYDALDWVAVKVWRNKFDLAARYPEYEEEILGAPVEDFGTKGGEPGRSQSCDDVPVLLFFHRRRPALPRGRESMILGNGTLLRDGALTYEDIPLFRINPADLIGTPFGYSQFFEILALQELIDSLETTAATNLTTFGTQNIYLPVGCDVQPGELAGGLRVIVGTQEGGAKPEALQLCKSPQELYSYLEEKKRDLEMIFGVNATVRGQVQSDKLSGAAMALLETQAKQQSSALHGSYRVAIQAIGQFVITEMRKRASLPRTISIVGKDTAFTVLRDEQFTGESLGAIKRVLVDIGNPLSQSVFGRAEQAKELVQMGLINNLEQYFMLLDSGRAEPITQALTTELLLIKSENEQIAEGITPQALISDNALLHCREHRTPAASPQARKNPEVLKAHMEHIHQHYEAYFGVPAMQEQVDPATGMPVVDPATGQPVTVPEPMYRTRMLVLMGMQPPDPALAAPMPGMGAPLDPAQAGAQPGIPQDPAQNTPAVPGSEPGQQAKQPKQPDLPKNPSTGQKWTPGDGNEGGTPPAV